MNHLKVNVTASVVCFNEGHLLDRCLSALQWCDEIIVIDIGSTDNSVQIAQKYTKSIFHLQKNPVVETYKIWVQDKAKHNWILYIDPDEVLSLGLVSTIKDFLLKYDNSNYGCVAIPWRFHFKGRTLKGTWGYLHTHKRCLINVEKTITQPLVHHGTQPKSGFEVFFIKPQKAFLDHYWMNSYSNLFRKHIMYLSKEGESRYKKGIRTSVREILNAPIKQFRLAYHRYQGYKDGNLGLFLSLFWALYQTLALIQLLRYQKVKR